MLRYRIIPVLLISDGKLVKTVKFKHPRYIGSIINAIKIFNHYGADELIVLNIDRTPPDGAFIRHIADECDIPFAYGGGIRTQADVNTVISNGAEKVVIRTHTEIIPECAEKYGAQAIVVCIDHNNRGLFRRGEEYRGVGRRMPMGSIGEIILQSIDRDGMMSGYDLKSIKTMSVSPVPIIALGGAGTVEHLREAKAAGADAVAAGSMFVYSKKGGGVLINYPDRETVKI